MRQNVLSALRALKQQAATGDEIPDRCFWVMLSEKVLGRNYLSKVLFKFTHLLSSLLSAYIMSSCLVPIPMLLEAKEFGIRTWF